MLGKGRILLVGDHAKVRASYSQHLAKEGFNVTEAHDGVEALKRAQGSQFDLVLTDLAIPKMDGMKLLHELKEEYPDMPVVVMMEAGDELTTQAALESGAFQTLMKPIDADQLRETARRALLLRSSRAGRLPSLRNRRGEFVEATSITATEAKKDFGRILERVMRGEFVLITRHEDPKAVLLSVEDFDALSETPTAPLNALRAEFDAMLARMQTPEARKKMQATFDASPEDLAKAAQAAWRNRD